MLSVEEFRRFRFRPRVGHDLTGIERGAIARHDAAVEAVRHQHDRPEQHRVDDVEEGRDAERAGRDDLRLITVLAIGGDEATVRQILEPVDAAHDADLISRHADDAGFENRPERQDAQQGAKSGLSTCCRQRRKASRRNGRQEDRGDDQDKC